MARWWIGWLVLLNAALLAWNMGALAPWGWAPASVQEGPSVSLDIAPQASVAQEAASAAAAPASAPASASKPAASSPRPKPVPAAAASESN